MSASLTWWQRYLGIVKLAVLALVIWLVTSSIVWWWLPTQPRLVIDVGDQNLVQGSSPDGRILVTSQGMNVDRPLAPVKLWDTKTARLRGSFLQDGKPVGRMATILVYDLPLRKSLGPMLRSRGLLFAGSVLAAFVVIVFSCWGYVRRRQRRAAEAGYQAERVARFLERGSPEHALEFLAKNPGATPAQQRDVLLRDQAFRWRTHCPRPVAEYLERFPEIAAHPELVLDLLAGDYRCAREQKKPVDRQGLLASFPALHDRLRQRLEALDSVAGVGHRAETAPAAPGSLLPGEATTSQGQATAGFVPSTRAPTQEPVPANEATHSAAVPAAAEVQPTRSFAPGLPVKDQDGVPPALATVDAPLAHPHASGGRQLHRIGRYVVERLLGEGAFGTVYLAHDEELRRPVAVKVPRRSRIATEADIQAYLAEARVVASLDHPAIVPVYDAGRTEDGRCYVVSKLIPGKDLAHRLRTGPLFSREAAEMVMRAAEALDHAHQRGLVHRDVKPANLLLDTAGLVYLADFGLAMSPEDFTGGSQLAGTPAYMSPEQARGEVHQLDGRSDLFSLGVVFYELLTGQRPFRGSTWNEIQYQILRSEPLTPRLMNTKVPAELSRICVKCLAKDPSDRYRTAQELATALRRWQKSVATAPGTTGELEEAARRIIPERLQPFQAQDTDFYLDLLPGVRGGDNLPAELRFWKSRLEEADPAKAFGVGLLTGPPGSGKSSLMKAGVLPRLAKNIQPVYIVAVPTEMENHLRLAICQCYPDFPTDRSLFDAFQWLRDEAGPGSGNKVLLVLDQFERRLMTADSWDNDLWRALSQCDGRRLQCLLVVREDFQPSVTSFLTGIGIPSATGVNQAAVQPFDRHHARKVLLRIGQALRRLPEDPADLTFQQGQLMDQAVAQLSHQGEVLPVRLAQLADTLKDMAWKPAALSQLGGLPGSWVALLENRIGQGGDEEQEGRFYPAAQAMLQALLPPAGIPVARHVRSLTELRTAAGFEENTQDLTSLLSILDEELRFVVSVPLTGTDTGSSTSWGYRLADDHLKAGVGQWLRLKPKEKRKGRGDLEEDFAARDTSFLPVSGCFLVALGLGVVAFLLAIISGHITARELSWSYAPLGTAGLVIVLLFILMVRRRPDKVRRPEKKEPVHRR